jgi:hypothetical protein
MLTELHAFYLKENINDEGDLIYYRINYKIVDTFGITKEDADSLHASYHLVSPRLVSQGYCDKCARVVTIIPVIYGIQVDDMERMKTSEALGRFIVGDMNTIKEGSKVAMFGCRECRTRLPQYGTL